MDRARTPLNRVGRLAPRVDDELARLLGGVADGVGRAILGAASGPSAIVDPALRQRAASSITSAVNSVYGPRRGALAPITNLITNQTSATWNAVLTKEARLIERELGKQIVEAIARNDPSAAEFLRMAQMRPDQRLAMARTFDDARTWVDPNGYRLSDRVWQSRATMRTAIDREIQRAIVRGDSAADLATLIERYLTPRGAASRTITGVNPRYQGEGSFSARRLARTEITRAFGNATLEAASRNPMVIGIRWALSSSHPKPDRCLTAGTLVLTEGGPRPIEHIEVGDRVLTHRGRYRPVTRLYRHAVPTEEVMELRTRGATGRIHRATLTRNHPVLTDQGWIPAGDLHTGSRVVTLPSWPDEIEHPRLDCVSCIALSGFGESVHAAYLGIGALARCGEHPLLMLRTLHKWVENSLCTNALPQYASGIALALVGHPPSLGFAHPFGPLTLAGELQLTSTIFRDDVSHSSGCAPQSWGRRRESSTSLCCIRNSGSVSHTSGRSWLRLHGQRGNTHWSRTFVRSLLQTALHQMLSHTLGMSARSVASSPRHDTRLSKTDALQSGTGDGLHHPLDAFQYHSVHTVSSYISPWVRGGMIPVYNIEVEGDNSYVAEGIVMHNCDDHANADGYGLGSGVYPVDRVPSYPQHPFCMCVLSPQRMSRSETVDFLRAKYGLDEAA